MTGKGKWEISAPHTAARAVGAPTIRRGTVAACQAVSVPDLDGQPNRPAPNCEQEDNKLRQALSKGMLTAAAVTGILSVPGAFAFADADADATATGSAGLIAGNNVSVPIHVPLNVCGNSINVLAVLNPTTDNTCVNVEHVDVSKHDSKEAESPAPKPVHEAPAPERNAPVPQAHTLPAPAALAETGGNPTTIAAAGLGVVMLTGGAVLYRRGRSLARR